MCQCKECKDFPKLNDLGIDNLYCRKKWRKENIDCSKEGHTIKVLQIERAKYTYHIKEKKNVQLVDKELTLPQFSAHLQDKLQNFPRHRHNVTHTRKIYDQVIDALSDGTIIKIQDFSENYTCLLPNEIMSIHWTQEQATVFPVVVLRKVNNYVQEDHFVFVSDDLKHDVPFI